MADTRFRPVFSYPPQPFYPLYPPLQPNTPISRVRRNVPDPQKRFYGDPNLHRFCLYAITRIHKTLYSYPLIQTIFQGHDAPTSELDCFQRVYALFLKGSNAFPLLQMESSATLGSPVAFPIFSSDFDCTLLIDPANPSFQTIRDILLTELVYCLMSCIDTPFFWAVLQDLYEECGFQTDGLGFGSIDVRSEALTPEDMAVSEHVYTSEAIRTARIMPGCPFQFVIHPNLSYRGSSLGFALFKIQTRTVPPLDILDISVPSRMYANIAQDWKLHMGRRIAILPNYVFFVSDYVATYIDYRLAAKKNTRKQKSKKRNNLANRLRNTILKPLKQRNLLSVPRFDNAELQTIVHNL